MKAMILAAGLGTRLRPWTLTHPKALVPVKGVPMLERVIVGLKQQGFDEFVVNIHHFGEQIIEFLDSREFGVKIAVSDERGRLLDTGGGILHARELLRPWESPVLVHNVDILSDADLRGLMEAHSERGSDSTLLVSDRESGRKLIFDGEMRLRGWHNLKDDHYRPVGFKMEKGYREYAFSGIHVVGDKVFDEMSSLSEDEKFSIIDYYMDERRKSEITGYRQENLHLIDIGKPATLSQADKLYGETQ